MIRHLTRGLALAATMTFVAVAAQAQQYAAYVMDARNGKPIHAVNADARLPPASLTKMMTLYIVFDQLKSGRMSLDQKVTISENAAAEPPSRLGLRPGQKIELRYLIRAAAIKSANDAATALGEAVAGSEPAFADRMNQYARAMGLRNTQFQNANGLTAPGHYSSARDMAEIGRRLFYDFPQYYNIFGRNSTSAGLATVQNTNRRLLDAYPGADGIKTGYTKAAGFNLVSSAERGQERVIVSVFGGKSSAARNAEVMRLMDKGFAEMPNRVRVAMPAPLRAGSAPVAVAAVSTTVAPVPAVTRGSASGVAVAAVAPAGAAVARTTSGAGALAESGRPMPRWMGQGEAIARTNASIATAIAEVNAELVGAQRVVAARDGSVLRPAPRPSVSRPVAQSAQAYAGSASTFAVAPPRPSTADPAETVAVAETAGRSTRGAAWGVQLGAFRTKGDAERHLLTMALRDLPELNGGLRRIEAGKVQGVTFYRAQFVGLSQAAAQQACASLARERTDCQTLAPGI